MGTTRRSLLCGLAVLGVGHPLQAQTSLPLVMVSKDPNCGCCQGWVAHIKSAGFETQVRNVSSVEPIKRRLNVPQALFSCHTAEVGGYAIEGHVPAVIIKRLLEERPPVLGLAVAGMPVGSPGMEMPGTPDDIYGVIAFSPAGQVTYARFKGSMEIAAKE